MILSMASIFIVNAHMECSRSIKSRVLNEEVIRNVENIKREIQYNVSREEIESEFLDNKSIGLMYGDDFSNEILNKKFTELDKGNDILITILSEDDENIRFQIKTQINKDGENVRIEDEFIKGWWMDEI